MNSHAALSFSIWIVSMLMISGQPAVLDTDGQPVKAGVEYYIDPAITDVAGGLTLVSREKPCPLYVGQEPLAQVVSEGISVVFEPFAEGENTIREDRDLTVTFQAASICVQNTAWRLAEENPETKRRYIATSGEANYFVIQKRNGVYNFVYCPTESCPNCKPRCGDAGIIEENNKRLLVLDGPAFPFQFRRRV